MVSWEKECSLQNSLEVVVCCATVFEGGGGGGAVSVCLLVFATLKLSRAGTTLRDIHTERVASDIEGKAEELEVGDGVRLCSA